jgi:hypothetical protein
MRQLPESALEKNNAARVGIVLLLAAGIICCYLNQGDVSSSLAKMPLPAFHISSGGLVGPAVDPGFGQANETGPLADYGYDTARDISRVCTTLSAIILSMIALVRGRMAIRLAANDTNRVRKIAWVVTRWGFLTVTVTLFVHFVGTFAINNYGGLCGGGSGL